MFQLLQQPTMANPSPQPFHHPTLIRNQEVDILTSFLDSLQLSSVRPLSPKDRHAKSELVKAFAALGFVMTEERHHNFFILARRFLSDELNRINDQTEKIATLLASQGARPESAPSLNHRDTLEYVAVNFFETFGGKIWPVEERRRGHLMGFEAPMYGVERRDSFLGTIEGEEKDLHGAKSKSPLCCAVSQYLRVAIMLPENESGGAALTEEEADALVEAIVAVWSSEAVMADQT